MSSELDKKKCQSCKKSLLISLFINEKEKVLGKCSLCREKINNKKKKHICEVCGIKAIFNFKGELYGILCSKHKEIGMVDVKNKKCEYNGCNKQPVFNNPEEKEGKFCSEHKEAGMINVKHKKCEHEGCNKQPVFNNPKEKEGKFCSAHKEAGMINVKHKKCEHDGCLKEPIFNNAGETKGKYCYDHKEEGMIDIKTKKCEHEGCLKIPCFNNSGETIGRFCSEHKEVGMIDVKTKKCEYQDCLKEPYFNNSGETIRRFCYDHKEEGMINVKNKKCEHPNCLKQSTFNNLGEKEGRFCSEHKEEGMIDVKNKKCDYTNCSTQVSYGYCGQSPTKCAKHKLNGMFKNPKRKCADKGCKEISTYGIKKPTHCETHSQENEMCLLFQKCKKCGDIDLLQRDNLCISRCHIIKEFEKQKSYRKEKETLMLNYLDKNLKDIESEYKIVDDKTIDTSCNLYRPDRRYDCGTHQVIIECDEHQHKYKEYCDKYKSLQHFEECRMFEIQQACGMNCIFIRWNPDTFKINGSVCKKYNSQKRLELLEKWIRHCINLDITHESPPKYIQLFFDEYDATNIEFKCINENDVLFQ